MHHDRSRLRRLSRNDNPRSSQPIIPLLQSTFRSRDELDAWTDAFYDAIETHHCPRCACVIEQVTQVGQMIDALPCGHRLGLGAATRFSAVYGIAVAEG